MMQNAAPRAWPLALAFLVVAGLYALDAIALGAPVPAIDSFKISCGTNATRIAGDGVAAGGFVSLYIQNEGTQPVALGDSSVTATTGPRICNDSACVRADWAGDVTNLHCIAAVAQDVLVIAGR